ncbi:uncharacterized protein MONBRDRAFT_9637 [Monosiga brevicollis MX1]|uniref:Uncharacterized protein n=1 Tax=Monosiga brevicollis TaxID=81824 RepID=A9V3X5_MONBE|nr:uncharacterized protein MONBRDRAFT_9637 [Monosiga brevicollis MX1]EDQ87787.1 predicted protein [Monosiga brevicollis MX1]|eukprot:XP_001747320.1 hypothetical protein [Monosiga brevicollis MX1]
MDERRRAKRAASGDGMTNKEAALEAPAAVHAEPNAATLGHDLSRYDNETLVKLTEHLDRLADQSELEATKLHSLLEQLRREYEPMRRRREEAEYVEIKLERRLKHKSSH